MLLHAYRCVLLLLFLLGFQTGPATATGDVWHPEDDLKSEVCSRQSQLDDAYQQLMAALPTYRRSRLEEGQRLWRAAVITSDEQNTTFATPLASAAATRRDQQRVDVRLADLRNWLNEMEELRNRVESETASRSGNRSKPARKAAPPARARTPRGTTSARASASSRPLPALSSLAGCVRDWSTSQPVAKATVQVDRIWFRFPDTPEEYWPRSFHELTDAGGFFQLRGIPPGEYRISVSSDNLSGLPARDTNHYRLDVTTTSQMIQRDFVLYEGHTLSGRAVDVITGRPVPRVAVGLQFRKEAPVVTDDAGRFALQNVKVSGPLIREPEVTLEIKHDDYRIAAKEGQSGNGRKQRVTLLPDTDRQEITVDLLPAGAGMPGTVAVSGRVEDVRGRPLRNVEVSLRSRSGIDADGRTRTSDDGTFLMHVRRRVPAVVIKAEASGYASLTSPEFHIFDEPVTSRVLTLSAPPTPSYAITGVVLRRNGQRAPAAEVRGVSARVGQDGRFTGKVFSPGTHRIYASKAGQGYSPVTTVQVGDNLPTPTVTLRLKGTGRISGRVIDPDGNPFTNVRVQADGDGYSESHDVPVDLYGRFRLTGLPVVPHTLEASSGPSDLYCKVRVETFDGREVVMQLKPSSSWSAAPQGRLQGRAVDALTGKPVSGLQVGASNGSEKQEAGRIGEFRVENVDPAKPLLLYLNAPGYAAVRVPAVPLSSGERSAPAVFPLTEGARVRGRLVPVSPDLLLTPTLLTFRMFDEESRRAVYDDKPRVTMNAADGSFSFSNVPAGPGLLTVYTTGLSFPSQRVIEVPAAGTLNLEPIFQGAGATLTGRVRTADGKPVHALSKLTYGRTDCGCGGPRSVTSDSDGLFRIGNLGEGSITVHLPGRNLRIAVDLGDDRETSVVWTLGTGTLLGTLLNSPEASGAEIELRSTREDGTWIYSTCRTRDGQFEFHNVPPGTWKLVATPYGDGAPVEQFVEISSRARRKVNVAFPGKDVSRNRR